MENSASKIESLTRITREKSRGSDLPFAIKMTPVPRKVKDLVWVVGSSHHLVGCIVDGEEQIKLFSVHSHRRDYDSSMRRMRAYSLHCFLPGMDNPPGTFTTLDATKAKAELMLEHYIRKFLKVV